MEKRRSDKSCWSLMECFQSGQIPCATVKNDFSARPRGRRLCQRSEINSLQPAASSPRRGGHGDLFGDVMAGAGTVSGVKLLAARERAVGSCFGSVWEGRVTGRRWETMEEAVLRCFPFSSKLHSLVVPPPPPQLLLILALCFSSFYL